jgi:uncharacterized membrane protein
MIPVLLALTAATTYGVADFFGGLGARSWRVFPTTITASAVAGAMLAVLVVCTGGVWSAPALVSGAIAALSAAIGFLTFYAALAAGPIAVVAPVIALLNSAVPVAWSAFSGAPLRPMQWMAIALAVIGSVLVGAQRGGSVRGIRGRTVVYTVISGLAFGAGTTALGEAPHDAGLIPVFLDASGAAVLLGILGLLGFFAPIRRWLAGFDDDDALPEATMHGPETTMTGPTATIAVRSLTARAGAGVWFAVVSGVLTGGANALLMLALHVGDLAVVAVLNNLYPVSTVILAWIVLRERLSLVQTLGAVLAVAASILLGLP